MHNMQHAARRLFLTLAVLALSLSGLSYPAQAANGQAGWDKSGSPWDFLFPFSAARREPAVTVVPGGQSIGIKLRAEGILVVGYHLIRRGRDAVSPGEQANLRAGDVIVAVDGRRVCSVGQVAKLIEAAGKSGKALAVLYRRRGIALRTLLRPVFDDETGAYRIGLFIRDSASGVGTLTFYMPDIRAFGALGHVIADMDTGEPIDGSGQIVRAAVTSIDRGESGQPGEIRGQFLDEARTLGRIEHNNSFGVFGHMAAPPDHGLICRPVPVAAPEDVHVGSADLLTVISGQRVQRFAAVIVRVNRQPAADVKGFIVRVTDPALLSRTGGIVQGMSGSPILQDGKLVGAVTHVFVSDPTQGYGVYAAWMVQCALQRGAGAGLRMPKAG